MLGGASMQAPCPKRLDSVEVTNKSGASVTVSVVFDNHKDKVELTEEHQIDAGATWHFTAKELDMGSWKAVAPVKLLKVTHANGTSSLEPAVSGVVNKATAHVGADGNASWQ